MPKQINLPHHQENLPKILNPIQESLKLNPFMNKIKPKWASSIADELDQESKWVQLHYPANPGAYMILKEIGGGARTTVHKAICFHNDVWQSSVAGEMFIEPAWK